jgi:hypothetical protein
MVGLFIVSKYNVSLLILSIHSFIHSFIHSSVALQPFDGPWPLFEFCKPVHNR